MSRIGKAKRHEEKVSVQCEATNKGYYGGRIIHEGEKFLYEGNILDGKFPSWMEPVKEYKSKFEGNSNKSDDSKKLTPSQKAAKTKAANQAKKEESEDKLKDLV